MKIRYDLYPVAVIQDRYNGAYSDGIWLAIAQADVPYDDTATRASWCLRYGPHGGDMDAIAFWMEPPPWIKVGGTPDEAIAALSAHETKSSSDE